MMAFLTASVVFHPQYKYMKFASSWKSNCQLIFKLSVKFPSAPLARNGCNENRLDSILIIHKFQNNLIYSTFFLFYRLQWVVPYSY